MNKEANEWKISQAQTGSPIDTATMQRFEKMLTTAQSSLHDANDVGGFHSYVHSVWHPGNSVANSQQDLQQYYTGVAMTGIKSENTEVTLKTKDAILSVTNSLDEFRKFGNGFGAKVIAMGQLIDSEFTANLQKAYASKGKATATTTNENYEADKAKREKEYAKQMAEQATAMQTGYAHISRTAQADTAVGHGQIGILEQQAAFAGKHVQTGDLHEGLAKRQATQLAGSDNVNVLGDRLRQLSEVQDKTKGFGYSESIAPMIATTVSALHTLADAANRTKGMFSDLAEVTNRLNSKYGVAESYFSSSKEGRQQMQSDKLSATKLIASGGDLNKLSIDEQQQALSHLNRFSNIKGAVAGSEYTGEELKKAVLEKSVGSGAFAPEKAERDNLQEKILGFVGKLVFSCFF